MHRERIKWIHNTQISVLSGLNIQYIRKNVKFLADDRREHLYDITVGKKLTQSKKINLKD